MSEFEDAWINTYRGRFSLYGNEPIDPVDIAHHLAHINRFNGALTRAYSVAQHSIFVMHEVEILSEGDMTIMGQALLHDAAEAYFCDIPAPWKRHLPDVQRLEQLIEKRIFEHFDLPAKLHPLVKQADQFAGMYEAHHLHLAAELEKWTVGCWDRHKDQVLRTHPPAPLEPEAAKGWFLHELSKLGLLK